MDVVINFSHLLSTWPSALSKSIKYAVSEFEMTEDKYTYFVQGRCPLYETDEFTLQFVTQKKRK